MNLEIRYEPETTRGIIIASNDVPPYIWSLVQQLAVAAQPDVDIVGNVISAEWATILSMAIGLSELRKTYGFSVEYEAVAKKLLNLYQAEYRATRAAAGSLSLRIAEEDIQARLDALGFSKRQLKPVQIRDTARMVALAHGANFSVPGAGKTTVAFAVHLLTRDEDTFLLVVAPKNAFGAWDEVINECLDRRHPKADMTPFTRLVGGTASIELLLAQKPRRLIISYDQLIRSVEPVRRFLNTHKVHVILDESHRMKSGDRSQRGSVLLSVAHLAARRDVLSGTPIPRSIDDIAPQLDFLWPGQRIGRQVASASAPHQLLRGLYVRTTKHELNLPKPHRHTIQIPMSEPQVALYSILRQDVLRRLAGIKINSSVDLMAARRSVMRLLQVSSNPILAVKAMTNDEPENYWYDDPKIEAIFTAISTETDSPKIREACALARRLAQQGQRSVIWTSFTTNVERIATLLADLGATYIHGQVDTGADTDPNTREGRIRNFHDDSSGCRVLVANPAACSEGISLHQVCHHAIYVDRTYNAAHYLQSVDRIHRLGLKPGVETHIHILESVAPSMAGAIDYSVRRRLIDKVRVMSDALEDPDLRRLALDEDEADQPLDYDITLEDLQDIIDELQGLAQLPNEDEE